jgi:hypothetical protein
MFIASIPLWIAGLLLFSLGAFGLHQVATNEADTPRFSSASDADAMVTSFALLVSSTIPLYLAAKVMS